MLKFDVDMKSGKCDVIAAGNLEEIAIELSTAIGMLHGDMKEVKAESADGLKKLVQHGLRDESPIWGDDFVGRKVKSGVKREVKKIVVRKI